MTNFEILIGCACVLLHSIVVPSSGAKLPEDWTRCRINEPDSNECLKKAVEEAIHKLINPAPEVGLTSLDPLLIPALTIGAGSGPVNVAQNFKNIKLHGLTGSIVLNATFDQENTRLLAESITPVLRLEADYSMNGRILLLPIQGNGPCNVTLINTHINHTLQGEKVQKKGKEYIRIVSYNVTLYPDKVEFKFDNLFNGDERLGAEINRVLNENQDAVFGDVRGGYEQSFGLIFQGLANRLFNRVALKDVFLNLSSSFFKRCRASDKVCLKDAIEDGIRKLEKGLPSFGLVPLDPLVIPEMAIQAGSIVNVQQHYRNVTVTGTKDITLSDAYIDLNKGVLFIAMSYPAFQLDADYNMTGRVLVLPVVGQGKCRINLDKPRPTYKAKFDIFQRKGKRYGRITSQEYHVNAGFARYYFENIFKGDKRLGEEINKVLNDNWKEIYDELVPSYEAAIGSWLSSIANRFFARVPINEIFLPEE
ncbi:circadian clock-controlled protein daywake-like [Coccinella septempunctata]|uniref:circadian clock-controlled protein daywake-like n=1 Tax=Coccinella septempunctata TaxID=41139 RepID=UPI001D097A83|nr:circadian clock-controlled protein daywake-like [Coccinella septempunctata]